MIEANELRLGNWVIDTDVNLPHQINDNSYPLKAIVNFIKPIELTEEILLKCGFEMDNDYYQLKTMYNSFFEYLGLEKGVVGKFNVYDLLGRVYICKPISYLHQLQNLYFALTQKELEVNL